MITKVFNLLQSLRKWYWRTFNIKTYGARVILLKNNKVFLVRHRYGNIWVFPGGGIKKGESPQNVARREVFEETGMIVNSFSRKLGVYKNNLEGKNDTITIFVTSDFSEDGKLNVFEKIMKFIEIKEFAWFDVNDLPKYISRASKDRINEHFADPSKEYESDW